MELFDSSEAGAFTLSQPEPYTYTNKHAGANSTALCASEANPNRAVPVVDRWNWRLGLSGTIQPCCFGVTVVPSQCGTGFILLVKQWLTLVHNWYRLTMQRMFNNPVMGLATLRFLMMSYVRATLQNWPIAKRQLTIAIKSHPAGCHRRLLSNFQVSGSATELDSGYQIGGKRCIILWMFQKQGYSHSNL